MSEFKIKIAELQRIREGFEPERDKLLDQVQYIKGQADRMEWVIKVLNGQIDQLVQMEKQAEIQAREYQKSLESARDKGNVGVHPDEKKISLKERKKKKKSTK